MDFFRHFLEIPASSPSCPLSLEALVSMGSGEYFPLNSFHCDSTSWRLYAGVVLSHSITSKSQLYF